MLSPIYLLFSICALGLIYIDEVMEGCGFIGVFKKIFLCDFIQHAVLNLKCVVTLRSAAYLFLTLLICVLYKKLFYRGKMKKWVYAILSAVLVGMAAHEPISLYQAGVYL